MNTSSNNENVGTADPFAKSNVLTITEEKWKSGEQNSATITNWLPRNDDGHQFLSPRYAILFEPGTYDDCRFEVGYYVTVAGLGETPEAVHFPKSKNTNESNNGDIRSTGPYVNPIGNSNCLCSFWRSAENFSAANTRWAVSQAAPLRRIKVQETLSLGKGQAYSSGGFLANADVGSIEYYSQQQWYCRNTNFKTKSPDFGNFGHLVLSGCSGEQTDSSNHPQNVAKTKPTVRVEKPFIVLNAKKEYELHVPAPIIDSTGIRTSGINLKALTKDTGDIRPFNGTRGVVVVDPVTPGGEEISDDHYNVNHNFAENEKLTKKLQAVLTAGHDLIISPGVFFLTASLIVEKKHKDQVILGLGMATLVAPTNGSPCIVVHAHSEGIRIAGLLLEASVWDKSNPVTDADRKQGKRRSLLDFGTFTEGKKDYNVLNPGALIDVFARVGGPGPIDLNDPDRNVSVDTMICIYSEYVVIDNSWYWRADHAKHANNAGIGSTNYKVDTALYVKGDYVTAKGLSAEHTLKENVIWDGNHGEIDFYQCEFLYYTPVQMPVKYDYSALKIGDNVTDFKGSGMGVYDIFFDGSHATHAISIPSGQKNIKLLNPSTVHIIAGGQIDNVVKVRSNPPQFYPTKDTLPNPGGQIAAPRFAWDGEGNHN